MLMLDTLMKFFPSLNQKRQRQYYDQATFHLAFPNNSDSDLSIFHVNIQSIIAKWDKPISYLSLLKRKFDIICLAETWYGDEKMSEIFFEQYLGFYSNRLSRKRGGASILISKQLNCQLTETLNVNSDFIEAVIV